MKKIIGLLFVFVLVFSASAMAADDWVPAACGAYEYQAAADSQVNVNFAWDRGIALTKDKTTVVSTKNPGKGMLTDQGQALSDWLLKVAPVGLVIVGYNQISIYPSRFPADPWTLADGKYLNDILTKLDDMFCKPLEPKK